MTRYYAKFPRTPFHNPLRGFATTRDRMIKQIERVFAPGRTGEPIVQLVVISPSAHEVLAEWNTSEAKWYGMD